MLGVDYAQLRYVAINGRAGGGYAASRTSHTPPLGIRPWSETGVGQRTEGLKSTPDCSLAQGLGTRISSLGRSALPRKRRSAREMRSIAKGQEETFAVQEPGRIIAVVGAGGAAPFYAQRRQALIGVCGPPTMACAVVAKPEPFRAPSSRGNSRQCHSRRSSAEAVSAVR